MKKITKYWVISIILSAIIFAFGYTYDIARLYEVVLVILLIMALRPGAQYLAVAYSAVLIVMRFSIMISMKGTENIDTKQITSLFGMTTISWLIIYYALSVADTIRCTRKELAKATSYKDIDENSRLKVLHSCALCTFIVCVVYTLLSIKFYNLGDVAYNTIVFAIICVILYGTYECAISYAVMKRKIALANNIIESGNGDVVDALRNLYGSDRR